MNILKALPKHIYVCIYSIRLNVFKILGGRTFTCNINISIVGIRLEPPPPPNNFYLNKAEQNTQTSTNLDLLKKMKEPRLLAHMLQAISHSLFSSILIDSFPNF